MPKTERLVVYEETVSESSTGQSMRGVGTKKATIWAELAGVDTEKTVEDSNEVVKETVQYLINERADIDQHDEFERTGSSKRYDVKSVQITEEGDEGDKKLVGVRIDG